VTAAPTRQITVLLIEDSDSDATHFDTMLQTAAPGEFVVARVTTLADATSYLRVTTPDCAVIDLKLTDAEGVEIIEALAVVPAAVALIVLTGHADDELAVTGIVAGAIDYARDHGAPMLEAYPIDPEGTRLDVSFSYVGFTTTFERAGFTRVLETSATSARRPRWLMRRDLRT